MKGGKYSKTLAKIWVEGIIRILDSRDAIRIRDIEDAMLELIRMSPNMADGNQQKHLLMSFDTKHLYENKFSAALKHRESKISVGSIGF